MAMPVDQPLVIGGVEEEQATIHLVREPGQGLGISIAGGLGSTPYKGEDEVCVGVCFAWGLCPTKEKMRCATPCVWRREGSACGRGLLC